LSEQKLIQSQEEEKVLESISTSKVVVPVLLGIGVILLLVWQQFDLEEFMKIEWGDRVLLYTLLAILVYIIRHVILSLRLMVLSDNFFSFSKSFELIIIWEFASAVSPTSIGGSAVSLFLLAQEKLSGAKTVTLVIYSVIADTIFFLISLPIIYFVLGPIAVRPEARTAYDLSGYGWTLLLIYLFFVIYSVVFTFGIFHPRMIKRIILFFGKLPIINRFQASIEKTADDVIITSAELRHQPIMYHVQVFLWTFLAWILRFFAITLIIMALVNTIDFSWNQQAILFSRSEIMHSITQFSPTPGGSGITELLFGGFYSDFINKGISSIVALLWRLVTYYPYLIAGAIIIPNWIRKIIKRRNEERELSSSL